MPSTIITALNWFFIFACPLLLIFQAKLLRRFANAHQSVRVRIWIGVVATVLIWVTSLHSVIVSLQRH